MIHPTNPVAPSAAEITRWPAMKDPSVARCHQVWRRVYRAVYKREQSRVLARLAAADAFRDALPALDSYANIRSFITCLGFGITTGVLFEDCCAGFFRAAALALKAESLHKKEAKLATQSKEKSSVSASQASIENKELGQQAIFDVIEKYQVKSFKKQPKVTTE